ncbi:MAG: DUF4911 domain-containing protein [Desulfobacteraceae bacterium]|nr:MAG: DUF4911 domain-containing protein [Desulfobacteraceae bacterium]
METHKVLYRIPTQDIAYLRMIIESYDGMAVVRTVDPRAALVELQISPGCETLVQEILDHLTIQENIPLERIDFEP